MVFFLRVGFFGSDSETSDKSISEVDLRTLSSIGIVNVIMLRNYQLDAVDAVNEAFKSADSVCLVMPTGSGKTITFAEIIEAYPGECCVIAHRRELIKQAQSRVNCRVCSVDAMQAGSWCDDIDLWVVDECHHIAADKWRHAIGLFGQAKGLGVTATPERLDGRPLDVFERLIVAAEVRPLIDQGYLSDFRIYAPQTVGCLVGDPVNHYINFAPGKRTICFVSSVNEAETGCGSV